MRTLLNSSCALVAACGLASCAHVPATPTHEHLDFLSRALKADPAELETLWHERELSENSHEIALRAALLQSIPHSARYNRAKAESELRALLAAEPAVEVASVARTRLETLQQYGDCRQRVDVLKKRLSKVADIERGDDK